MKRIYIILTKSPTILSKTISAVTKEPYTHSSISFSNTIQPMYSAGRDYALLPAPGHLKVEPLQSGFYTLIVNLAYIIWMLVISNLKNASHLSLKMLRKGYRSMCLVCYIAISILISLAKITIFVLNLSPQH